MLGAMATITKPSICRLCTAHCPIVVTIADGRAVAVHGDREAPLFEGYTCPKGRALPEMHASPTRLLHSLRKRPDGTHEPIGSAEAIDEIADRLRDVIDRHGPASVAVYIGTSNISYPMLGGMAGALMQAIGSPMYFSAATLDQPGTTVADALHGVWLGGRMTFDDADAWLFAGTNPLISHQYLGENPAKRLSRALEQGLRLVVVDPRRTETARRAHVHLAVRPGEDATLSARRSCASTSPGSRRCAPPSRRSRPGTWPSGPASPATTSSRRPASWDGPAAAAPAGAPA
jgi:anaerobic selenocysteine-containing dehydrogenase